MGMDNICIFTGRTTADLELRRTQTGTCLSNFTLAVTSGFGDNKKTSFLRMTVWGKSAEAMEKWIKKGNLVSVRCEAVQEHWTDQNGNKREAVKFTVLEWGFPQTKKEDGKAQTGNQTQAQSNQQARNDDFMNIPPGTDEELPFS